MAWRFDIDSLIRYMDSSDLANLERKIIEMGRLLESAPKEVRTECAQQLAALAKKDKERDAAEEQDLLTSVEFEEEEQRETQEFASNITRWFPSLASKGDAELLNCAYALLHYHRRKSHIH
jgi:hypothetical protein